MDSGELMHDVDTTIDQLLENAKALKVIENNPLFSQEKEYLEQTQESLLAHLVVVESHLKGKPQKTVSTKIRKMSRKSVRKSTSTRQARKGSLV